MKATDLYHTGIVVEDLDQALDWMSGSAGYRWGPVVGGDIPIITPDGQMTVTMRIAYSASEPRLELVQAIPGTIWVPTGAGVHHLGYWSDDVDADLEALCQRGCALEAKAPSADGSSMWAYCNSPAGPRIELVARSMEPVIRTLFQPTA
jgi:hypothetical protein